MCFERKGKGKGMMISLRENVVCKGGLDSLDTSALTGAFRVRVKVVLHTVALLFVNVDPTLRKEGVRVGKHSWVGLMEYGCHADDGLSVCQ